MKLLIVESPKKAKEVGKMLGAEWTVVATKGHFCDLPERDLGVAPPEFRPTYVTDPDKSKTLAWIKKLVKEAESVYLATDPDREGEAIAWHLQRELGLKAAQRVTYQEVTKTAVLAAIAAPRKLNLRLVAAQEARRVLDRLAGYLVSGRVSDHVGQKGLSAGRVQSPALGLIVMREREIRSFVKREYWGIKLDSNKAGSTFTAALWQYRGEKLNQFDIPDEAAHRQILNTLKDKPAVVRAIERKERLRNPSAPFKTSTLQQEGVRKLSMSTDQVMRTAQALYEGIELAEGSVGLITYHRTDATALAPEAIASIRSHIETEYGAAYLPAQPIIYKTAAKNAQEAHEACRPTSIERTPASVRARLSDEEFRLYEMIWQRTVACQMMPARYDTTAVDIEVGAGLFRVTGSVLTFPGYLAVYQDGKDDDEGDDASKLPPLSVGEALPIDKLYGQQSFTSPPPRYTEATLVKALEEHSIGRPSTYVSIAGVLTGKAYVKLVQKKFAPTTLGEQVFDFLSERFAFAQLAFTADMENDLDLIADGSLAYATLVSRFYTALEGELAQLPPRPERFVVTEHACPDCGKPLRLMSGKHGEFFSCSGYPECKKAMDSVNGVPTPRKPKAESATGKKHAIGDKCPKCGKGELLQRDAREAGKHFLGCNKFPSCKFMEWMA